MAQCNKMFPYLLGAAALAVVLSAAGIPLGNLLPFAVVLACPLMMVFMMRGMASGHRGEDHTGHGCEHDPTRRVEPPDQSVR